MMEKYFSKLNEWYEQIEKLVFFDGHYSELSKEQKFLLWLWSYLRYYGRIIDCPQLERYLLRKETR